MGRSDGVGRPPLELGGIGLVTVTQRGGQWRARARVRDMDGRTRQVERMGRSRQAAVTALHKAVKNRNHAEDRNVKATTTIAQLAEAYYSHLVEQKKSVNTLRVYRSRINNLIVPALGGLRTHELTTSNIERHLQQVVNDQGAASAKMVRTILIGMCALAAKDDALTFNPAKLTSTIRSEDQAAEKQALTLEEVYDLRAKLRLDPQAVKRDIPFLVDGLMATGLRISEVLALEIPAFDLEAGTYVVGKNMVIRETGVGLYIRYAKRSSKLKPRELDLPEWFLKELRLRFADAELSSQVGEQGPYRLAFPSEKGRLRDPSNTGADIGDAMAKAGYGWVTPHTFRRTLATLLFEHRDLRAAQEQLGHRHQSMTEGYVKRRRATAGTGKMLDQLLGDNAAPSDETPEDED